MYSQATGPEGGAGQQQGPNPGAENQQGGEDKKVENADYEVIDDDKK
jgi:hypothetical protein